MSRHHARRRALVALLAVLSFAGTCDRTRPGGTIQPSPVRAKIAEPIALTLEVKADQEGIHRETWVVDPPELGELSWDEAADRRRRATFVGRKAGRGTIRVSGFLRQTNPQPIAEVAVTVE